MLKKTIAGIAAMMTFATASAAPVSYEFEWKGFDAFTSTATGETTGGWNPLASIRGYFQGEDRNGDNTIRGEELDRFGFYDQTTGERLELIGCPDTGAGASGLTGCNVGWFSYSQEGGLMLSGNAQRSSNGQPRELLSWSMPNGSFSQMNLAPCCSSSWLRATADTQFTIAAAVPEPSTWAMLAGGLLVAGATARRRSRAG